MSGLSHATIDAASDRSGPAGPVRTAMQALFARLGVRPDSEAETARLRLLEGVAPETGPCRSAAARELKQRAHAAAVTVEGGGSAALDIALDVLAEELRRARPAGPPPGRGAEGDPPLRARTLGAPDRPAGAGAAGQRPAGLPGFLVCNELDKAEVSVMAARHFG